MSAKAEIRAVETSEIPAYPIEAGLRLESHYFINFHFNRWLTSDFRLLASDAVRAWAFDLFCVAQNQAPVGTLPMDETLQARLLGVDLSRWRELCALQISPLYNWSPCLCGDEVRLAHPVVTEIALDATKKRSAYLAKREADQERKRRLRLAEQIREAGGHSNLCENPAYVSRLDEWLVANCQGNRTTDRVREGMEQLELGVL